MREGSLQGSWSRRAACGTFGSHACSKQRSPAHAVQAGTRRIASRWISDAAQDDPPFDFPHPMLNPVQFFARRMPMVIAFALLPCVTLVAQSTGYRKPPDAIAKIID